MYSSYNRSFKDYPVENSDYADQNNFPLEHAPGHGESGHDDGYHRHQLDKDVQAGAGSVLEGVTYRIAYHSCLVNIAALAAEVAFLYVFLGIVPCTARVGHEDSQYETAAQAAYQQTQHTMMAMSDGTTISRCAPRVEMDTQRA